MKRRLQFLALSCFVVSVLPACDGRVVPDDDKDGISNRLEISGYTYSPGRGLQAWQGGEEPHFKTDPRRWSTDGDPYSDYMEATGINMPAGVPAPENHPLIAARPIIAVFMESFDIIPIATKSTGQNTSKMTSSSHTTSNTNTVGGEVGVEAQTKVGGSLLGPEAEFSQKVSLKASYSHTWVSTDTESSSQTTGSSSNVTVDPSRAARLKLRLYYENVGSSPARDVSPTFTLSLGEKTIATIMPTQTAQMMNRAGRPRSRYPETGAIVVGDRPEDEIILSLAEVEAMRDGAVMLLDVTQVSARMSRWDEVSNTWNYDNDWVNYAEEIDEVTATIGVRNGDSTSAQYWAYAGTDYQETRTTLRDVLSLLLPTESNELGQRSFDGLPASQWAYAVDPGIDASDAEVLLGSRLDRDTSYLLLRPDNDPAPRIALAEFNSERNNVSVSVDPGDFPVRSVEAILNVGEETVTITLDDSGEIAYQSPEPFSQTFSSGKIVVRDVAGYKAERPIAEP